MTVLFSISLKGKEAVSEVQNSTTPIFRLLLHPRENEFFSIAQAQTSGAENYTSRHAKRGPLPLPPLPPSSRAGRRRLAGPVPAVARSGRAWGAASPRRQLMICRYSTILPAMGRVLGLETHPPSLPRRPPTRYRVGWGREPRSPGADDAPMLSPVVVSFE